MHERTLKIAVLLLASAAAFVPAAAIRSEGSGRVFASAFAKDEEEPEEETETPAVLTSGEDAEDSEEETETAETDAESESEPAETEELFDAAVRWKEYDQLIAQIRTETDTAVREALMHEAEDMLMNAGAVIPLYYYNDVLTPSGDAEGNSENYSAEESETAGPAASDESEANEMLPDETEADGTAEKETGTDEIQDPAAYPELSDDSGDIGTCCVCFNVNGPLFAGRTAEQAGAVRRALALLIDRDYIAGEIISESRQLANTLIPPGMSDGSGGEFRRNDDDYTYPCEEADGYYDPANDTYGAKLEEALALLAGAGFEFDEDGTLSDETPLRLTCLVRKGTVQEKIAKVIRQDFAVIGAKMKIDSRKRSAFLRRRKAGKFDLIQDGCMAVSDDPYSMLAMWTTDSDENIARLGK